MDGTGPKGLGPMTGRGLGNCQKGSNDTPFRNCNGQGMRIRCCANKNFQGRSSNSNAQR